MRGYCRNPHKLMGKYKWQVISQNGAFVLLIELELGG